MIIKQGYHYTLIVRCCFSDMTPLFDKKNFKRIVIIIFVKRLSACMSIIRPALHTVCNGLAKI